MSVIKNLEDAKVGDEFMVFSVIGWGRISYAKRVVIERITPNQVFAGGVAYTKKSAKPYGHSNWLHAIDHARVEKGRILVRRHNLITFNRWLELPDDKIDAIADIIFGAKQIRLRLK